MAAQDVVEVGRECGSGINSVRAALDEIISLSCFLAGLCISVLLYMWRQSLGEEI